MHQILSLWKEQGGKGTYITNDDQDTIRAIEIAINTLVVKDPNVVVGVITPPSKVYTYLNYFSDRVILSNNVVRYDIVARDYFCLFIVSADTIPKFIMESVLKLKTKYVFATAANYDLVNPDLKERAPKIDYISRKHREYNYIVNMDVDTQKHYDEIAERMADLMLVFRDYNNITGCIAGNNYKSAMAFRDQFAADNGWSRDLNTDIKMFADIDKYYNPDNLFEQATLYNTLVRERDKVIAKSQDKIDHTVAVILANNKRKFLVLAKGDDTCEAIASKIRKVSKTKVEAIHANTASRSLNDENGNPILVKTGANKGSVKIFGTKTVNDSILADFNHGKLRTLVTTGTLDKTSTIEGIDVLLITSAKAANYYELKSRISKLTFKSDVIIINIAFNIEKDIDIFKKKQFSLNLDVTDVFNLADIVL